MDRHWIDLTNLVGREVFEDFFYSLSASDFDDKDELWLGISVVKSFGKLLDHDVDGIVAHLEQIRDEIPEEEDQPSDSSSKQKVFIPETEVFDVESAFRSLLPEE